MRKKATNDFTYCMTDKCFSKPTCKRHVSKYEFIGSNSYSFFCGNPKKENKCEYYIKIEEDVK